ncbi:MAG: hypothetical protein AAFX04_05565 [Pseudomonadota bacterium]
MAEIDSEFLERLVRHYQNFDLSCFIIFGNSFGFAKKNISQQLSIAIDLAEKANEARFFVCRHDKKCQYSIDGKFIYLPVIQDLKSPSLLSGNEIAYVHSTFIGQSERSVLKQLAPQLPACNKLCHLEPDEVVELGICASNQIWASDRCLRRAANLGFNAFISSVLLIAPELWAAADRQEALSRIENARKTLFPKDRKQKSDWLRKQLIKLENSSLKE